MFSPEEQVPLAPRTTLGVGGNARFFSVANSLEDIQQGVAWAREHGLQLCIMGKGSNMLVSDKGFDGLMMSMNLQEIEFLPDKVVCGAGVPMARVAAECVKHNRAGFAWAIGIPGTIGGSVYGNAGCFGGEMKDAVAGVEVIDMRTGATHTLSVKECLFEYRESIFKQHPEWVITHVTLALPVSSDARMESEKQIMRNSARMRVTEQEIGARTAGSMFKGIPITEQTLAKLRKHGNYWHKGHEHTCWIFESRRGLMSAGFLIDIAGLRGTRVGGVLVSRTHANFFVNDGTARAEDVVMLIGLVKERVHRTYGIFLEEEIRYIGF